LKCNNEVNANIEELNTNLGADIQTFIERYVYQAYLYLYGSVEYSSSCP